MCVITDIHFRYFKPIEERAVTAIVVTSLSENVKVGDNLTLSFNGFYTDELEVCVTGIERLRIDEFETRHVVACGYAHKDLLEDHLSRDLGIDTEEGSLVYFIEFDESGLNVLKSINERFAPTVKIAEPDDHNRNLIQEELKERQRAFRVSKHTMF